MRDSHGPGRAALGVCEPRAGEGDVPGGGDPGQLWWCQECLGLGKAGWAAESWFLSCTAQGLPEAFPRPEWSLWEPRDSSLSHSWLGEGECRCGVTSLSLCPITGKCVYKGTFSNAALEVCQRKEKWSQKHFRNLCALRANVPLGCSIEQPEIKFMGNTLAPWKIMHVFPT